MKVIFACIAAAVTVAFLSTPQFVNATPPSETRGSLRASSSSARRLGYSHVCCRECGQATADQGFSARMSCYAECHGGDCTNTAGTCTKSGFGAYAAYCQETCNPPPPPPPCNYGFCPYSAPTYVTRKACTGLCTSEVQNYCGQKCSGYGCSVKEDVCADDAPLYCSDMTE